MKFTNISFVLVAVLSISCKKVYEVNPNVEPKPAKLSVFNACTDCGAVSFYLGTKKFLDKDIDFMTELGYQDSPTNKMELSFSAKGSTTTMAKKKLPYQNKVTTPPLWLALKPILLLWFTMTIYPNLVLSLPIFVLPILWSKTKV
jgi:hypothetical protein